MKKIFKFIGKFILGVFKFAYIILGILAGMGGAASNANASVTIKDYSTGMTLYSISGSLVQDYRTGRNLYEWSSNRFSDYQTGRNLYEVDGNYIKDYQTGRRLYQTEGLINYLVVITILIDQRVLAAN